VSVSVCFDAVWRTILPRYLYYFENGNPIIHVRYISGLIALINEQSTSADAGSPAMSSAVESHYKNTLGMFFFLLFYSFKRCICVASLMGLF
jgi:hypothetical protein